MLANWLFKARALMSLDLTCSQNIVSWWHQARFDCTYWQYRLLLQLNSQVPYLNEPIGAAILTPKIWISWVKAQCVLYTGWIYLSPLKAQSWVRCCVKERLKVWAKHNKKGLADVLLLKAEAQYKSPYRVHDPKKPWPICKVDQWFKGWNRKLW
ncbi:hypothetical protein HanRHA438_Chr14g0657181 [Helianthus annuus]|nr:hypothetical protein HanRHA438_Chr14g0657181 [Helianthus annuus]